MFLLLNLWWVGQTFACQNSSTLSCFIYQSFPCETFALYTTTSMCASYVVVVMWAWVVCLIRNYSYTLCLRSSGPMTHSYIRQITTVHVTSNSCNIDMSNLPDTYVCPKPEGTHNRQITTVMLQLICSISLWQELKPEPQSWKHLYVNFVGKLTRIDCGL